MHDPALLARDLEHEDVVDVVVRREPPRGGWRHVRVDLHGMADVVPQASRELDHGRPDAVERLEDDRRPVGEEPCDRRLVDLVPDRGPDAAPGA